MHPLALLRAGATALTLTLVAAFPGTVAADTASPEASASPGVPEPPGLLLTLDQDELVLELAGHGPEPATAAAPDPPSTPWEETGPATEAVPQVGGTAADQRHGPEREPETALVAVSPATLGTDTVWLSGLSPHETDPEHAVSAASGVDTTGVRGSLDDSVRVTLTEVEGPGEVGLYTEGLAPLLLGDGTEPVSAALPEGRVTDAAWGFGEPGEYTVTFEAAATLSDGHEVTTERTHRLVASAMAPVPEAAPPRAPLPRLPERPEAPDPPEPAQEADEASPSDEASDALVRPMAADDEPAVGGETVTLNDGHVDVAGRVIDGDLELSVKDGTRSGTTTWRTLDSAVLEVAADARQEWPSGSSYDFLTEAGADVWMIPQVQRQGVVWAGWNTEEITSGQVDGQVTWTLHGVRGPGGFALFSTSSFGSPEVLFDGSEGANSFEVPLGTHAHGNWAFAATGSYELDFEMSATLTGGERVSDTGTLRVTVVSGGGGSGGGGGNGDGGGNGGNGDGGGSGGGSGDGGGSGAGGGSGSGGPEGRLPRTGDDLVPFVLVAALLTLLGGTAVLAARTRRRPDAPTA
ncbi:choice-of-anchor M domain-containing protein [Nocardiopsis synnemataformans]|uniref:choice-of-anchor M domain-containing protein n=1 Tax=Nocardiopsis synnemataformans TaxID=61305 RepID=UPI003EBB2382